MWGRFAAKFYVLGTRIYTGFTQIFFNAENAENAEKKKRTTCIGNGNSKENLKRFNGERA